MDLFKNLKSISDKILKKTKNIDFDYINYNIGKNVFNLLLVVLIFSFGCIDNNGEEIPSEPDFIDCGQNITCFVLASENCSKSRYEEYIKHYIGENNILEHSFEFTLLKTNENYCSVEIETKYINFTNLDDPLEQNDMFTPETVDGLSKLYDRVCVGKITDVKKYILSMEKNKKIMSDERQIGSIDFTILKMAKLNCT